MVGFHRDRKKFYRSWHLVQEDMAMVDETRQILEMLSNGTLTAEQAAELLDALDDRPATPPPPPRRAPSREREHRKRLRMNPALEKLAEARLHGVDADYIREMH